MHKDASRCPPHRSPQTVDAVCYIGPDRTTPEPRPSIRLAPQGDRVRDTDAMPAFIPDIPLSDCWGSVGEVTFYHRNGRCMLRSRPRPVFGGSPAQLRQLELHRRAIAAWGSLSHRAQAEWNRLARGVPSRRPPFGDGNSISGYCLFLSAYHGLAALGREGVPSPAAPGPFPVHSLAVNGARTEGSSLVLETALTLEPSAPEGRFRLLAMLQLAPEGRGRNPGMMRRFLPPSPAGPGTTAAQLRIPDYAALFRLGSGARRLSVHIRHALLDTITGLRSDSRSLSAEVDVRDGLQAMATAGLQKHNNA